MRGFGYSAAACAAVMVTVVCAGAQTMLDLQSQARNVDFSAAASTRPFPVGTLLPPVCNPGATFFRSDARAGQNLYLCTATNIWTAVEGAQQIQTGSTNSLVITAAEDDSVVMDVNPTVVTTQDGNNTFTGSNDFSRAATLQVVVSNTKPAAAACNANKVGSVALRKGDSMSGNVLYICQTTPAGGFAWKAASYGYGSGKPSSCDAGEMFFDLNGAAGQQWFGCVATNTWASVGGGGASLPPQTANGGNLLGTNGTSAGWRSIAGFTDDGKRLVPDGTVLAELTGNNLWTGQQRFPASPTQQLSAATDRIRCDRRTVAISAVSPLTLTSAATILDGSDGQVCTIVNAGAVDVMLQDQDTLPASNLQLPSPRLTIPPKGQVTLQYSQAIGDWVLDGVAVAGARTITGTNGIVVTNGNGVAGDPVVSMPGSIKGDLIVHNGTANTRVAAGTDGQTLVSDSTQPAGLKWGTRRIAGANGLTATNPDWTSGDTATLALPGTSKGDIMVHNGTANTRLAAGASAQTLVADPAQPEGVKWSTRRIAGANGVTVTNPDWSAGDTASISLPGSARGDLIVHDGTANVRQTAGPNRSFVQYDSSQPTGVASAYAPIVRKCAIGTGNNTNTHASLGSVILTGLQTGGMIRYYARYTTTGATTGFVYFRTQLGGANIQGGTEITPASASNTVYSFTGTIHLIGASAQTTDTQAVSAASDSNVGGALDAGMGKFMGTSADLSSGSALLDFQGRSSNIDRTLNLIHYCVEYYPAVP